MKTLLIFLTVVTLASVSLALDDCPTCKAENAANIVYTLGATGCGNNNISCWDDPVSNGTELSFTSSLLWYWDGKQGRFTYYFSPDYPNPVPLYKEFYFHQFYSGDGISVMLDMTGYKGRYGVTHYNTTGGTLTVQ